MHPSATPLSRRAWLQVAASGIVLGALRVRAAGTSSWDTVRLRAALDFLQSRGGADGVKEVVIADRQGVVWRGESASRSTE